MSEELPKGWCWAKVEELAEYNPKHPQETDDFLPVSFVPMQVVNECGPDLKGHKERPFGEIKKGFNHFSNGDVLIAKITPCFENGKAAIARNLINGLGCGTTELHVLRPSFAILPEYLYRFLHRETFRKTIKPQMTGTAGQLRVPSSVIKEQLIPLPPLPEQRRIVAKLDEILPKLQACKERLEKVAATLKRFRQAVLAAAVSGKLLWKTKNDGGKTPQIEWVDKPEWASDFPDDWRFCKVGQILDWIEAGKNFSCPGTPVRGDKIGLVKISAVTWDEFDENETKTVVDDFMVNPSLFIESGDLLVTRANTRELVGASVIVREVRHKIMISDKVWRVHLKDFHKGFFHFFLKSIYGRVQIVNLVSGNQAAMFNLSQKAFAEIVVPYPPLNLQKKIYEMIDELLIENKVISKKVSQQLALSSKICDSVLNSAFSGTLVPQDPTDEPAAVLLERLKSAPAVPVRRGRKAARE